MNGLPSLQWAGPLMALVTFATIGAGHMLVRRLHARYSVRPGAPFMILGGLVLVTSLLTASNLLSGILGLIGVTLAWDGIEFYRQERRLRRAARDEIQ